MNVYTTCERKTHTHTHFGTMKGEEEWAGKHASYVYNLKNAYLLFCGHLFSYLFSHTDTNVNAMSNVECKIQCKDADFKRDKNHILFL